MKVKYTGNTFGVASLTDGKTYECLGVEDSGDFGKMLRIIDDSEEDYLYSPSSPEPLDGSSSGGKWQIIEDDDAGTLKQLIK